MGADKAGLPALHEARLELEERVAVLTLDRDDVRNALTGTALIDDIVDTCSWVNATPQVSVLILTGAGSAFSAGGNIKEMRDRDQGGSFGGDVREVQDRYRLGIQRIPLALQAIEVPTIAAVNGPAIGAGFDLACMCDMRIAADRALFGETFVNLGIIPGDGGAWFLQRLVGYQRAAEMTFSGRLVKAEEAQRIGLVLEVVAGEELMTRARALAGEIAAKPPVTVRFTKRLMQMAQRQELKDFLDLCACFQGMCHNTADHLEAVNAFLEKRAGKYQGR